MLKDLISLPVEVVKNRKMIFKLAKNDFKTKYAGSYLGAVWAFVQPVITVLIYIFVFQVGFKAAPIDEGYPFVLYLIGGIVGWFFFSEAWLNATNCLIEYSYLVKKVVFKISILPIVKIVSSLFVHLFFVVLSTIIFCLNGKYPTISYIQIVYYMFANICLVTALSYLTASIAPFFKDITQIINIVVQVGMWMTPIMWNETIMPPLVMKILKFNPMYYVVQGYRDAFINNVWITDKLPMTLYFWFVVIVLFVIGFRMFNKLRVHFADVL